MSQIPATPASAGAQTAQTPAASVANPAQSGGGESFLLALLGQLLGGSGDAAELTGQPDKDPAKPLLAGDDDKPAANSGPLPGNILPLPPNPPQQLPAASSPAPDTDPAPALDAVGDLTRGASGKGGDSSQWLKMLQTLVQSAPADPVADKLAAARSASDAPAPSHDAPPVATGPLPGAVPPPPSQTPAQPSVTLNLPMTHPQWGQDLGSKVTWLLGQGIQDAKLQLHPQHLGPVQVHISLNDNQAAVNFVAHHADTRDALQAALPQLRDMLQQSGIQLGQAQVSAQGGGQAQTQADGRQSGGAPGHSLGGIGEDDGGLAAPGLVRQLQGLFDDYA